MANETPTTRMMTARELEAAEDVTQRQQTATIRDLAQELQQTKSSRNRLQISQQTEQVSAILAADKDVARLMGLRVEDVPNVSGKRRLFLRPDLSEWIEYDKNDELLSRSSAEDESGRARDVVWLDRNARVELKQVQR